MIEIKLDGLGQGVGETIEILKKKEIVKKINELGSREIIEKAYDGYVKGMRTGYATIDLKTGQLQSDSLGQNEHNQAIDDVQITIYKIDQNQELIESDILSKEEIEEGKIVGYNDVINYLEYYFELDWNNINEQLKDWYEAR